MQQSKMEIKRQQMIWRQQKVIELAADGYTEREIAAKLQISDTTIHRDLTLLKQQAKDSIRSYIEDKVPFEYHKTLEGLQGIIKSMSNIIASSTDNKEIMQASVIKIQAYNMRMELVSNANLVYEAMGLVDRYKALTTNVTTSGMSQTIKPLPLIDVHLVDKDDSNGDNSSNDNQPS